MRDYRNKPYPVKAKIRYEHKVLTVSRPARVCGVNAGCEEGNLSTHRPDRYQGLPAGDWLSTGCLCGLSVSSQCLPATKQLLCAV